MKAPPFGGWIEPTGRGNGWTEVRVRSFRDYHQIAVQAVGSEVLRALKPLGVDAAVKALHVEIACPPPKVHLTS
jgi:hypothetical protein